MQNAESSPRRGESFAEPHGAKDAHHSQHSQYNITSPTGIPDGALRLVRKQIDHDYPGHESKQGSDDVVSNGYLKCAGDHIYYRERRDRKQP